LHSGMRNTAGRPRSTILYLVDMNEFQFPMKSPVCDEVYVFNVAAERMGKYSICQDVS
jgi:hypothetical protein